MKILINKYQVAFLTTLLLVLCEIGTLFFSELRLLKYFSLPFLFVIAILVRFKINTTNIYLNNELILSFLIMFFGLFFGWIRGNMSSRGLEEGYFIILPLLIVYLINNDNVLKHSNVVLMFLVYSSIYIFSIFSKLILVFKNPSLLIDGFTSSNLPTESSYAFVLGLFVIYFSLENKKWLFIISSIIFLLAFKRIALLGVIIVLFIILSNYLFKINKNKFIFPIVFGSILSVLVLISVGSGKFDKEIYNYTGKSANKILMGRQNLYKSAFERFPIEESILGNGLGSLTTYFKSEQKSKDSIIGDNLLLHSDLLKIILELGVLVFLIWIYLKTRINIFSSKSLAVFVYLLFLLLTDNVSIYFNVLLVYYFIQANYYSEKKKKQIESSSNT